MSLLRILLATCLSFSVHSEVYKKYYVTNTSNFSCEIYQPCYTLHHLAENVSYFPPEMSITFVFISKNYVITENLNLNFTHFGHVELKPRRNDGNINLYCIGSMSISFWNVSQVTIDSMIFTNCGKYKAVITFLEFTKPLKEISICNSKFVLNLNGSISISSGVMRMVIQDCVFDRNHYGIDITLTSIFSGYITATTFLNNEYNYIAFSGQSNDKTLLLHLTQCNFTGNNDSFYIWSINEVLIRNCTFLKNSANTGGAIFYSHNFYVSTKLNSNKIKTTFTIIHTLFHFNNAEYGGALAAFDYGNFSMYSCILIGNQAGQYGGAIQTNHGNGYFNNCTFVSNYALLGGSISFSEFDDTRCLDHTNCLITECLFENNTAFLHGGAISAYDNDFRGSIHIKTSIFKDNKADFGAGIYFSGTGAYESKIGYLLNLLDVTSCLFIGNKADINGGAIAIQAAIHFDMQSNLFYRNTAYNGGAVYIILNQCLKCEDIQIVCHIINCTFKENEASYGGATYLKQSHMKMTDVMFIGNIAHLSGGGVFLNQAFLSFKDDQIKFIGNKAELKGGAILVKNDECSIFFECSFSCSSRGNKQITFANNSATAGSIIYVGIFKKCKHHFDNQFDCYKSIADNDDYNLSNSEIIFDPIKLCYCEDSIPVCISRQIYRAVIPGKKLNVIVACVDALDRPISCELKIDYAQSGFSVGQGEYLRNIQNSSCQIFAFHVYSKDRRDVNVSIITDHVVCDGLKLNTLAVSINILPCPRGFEKFESRCDCDHFLKEAFSEAKCDIETELVTVNKLAWFSYNNGYFRAHQLCPFNYCNSRPNVSVRDPDSQCAYNRGGVLCGGCVANYSVVLGSWKCMDCSHLSRYNFIWLTVLLALAGVVLVVFLFVIKMTVSSGTTNGLLLYANILSSSGLLDHNTCSVHPVHPVLRVFLSWINLDLGIEVCYYSGMDVYQKTWLQFIFPFYIWFLVGVIILFCHNSSRVMKLMGMRNIEVLATLFLLSYAKLLNTIVATLSFTNILVATNNSETMATQNVWIYDGNIRYLGVKHSPLFIIALMFLLFLFWPYTLLLIFGQCIHVLPKTKPFRWTHRIFVTIIDTYHAPYNKHFRFWTGLGLLVRCFLYCIFEASHDLNTNLLWITTVMFVLLTVKISAGKRMYLSSIPDILELFYFSNLGIFSAFQLVYNTTCMPLTISITVSFIGFFCILAWHVHLELQKHFDKYTVFLSILKVLFLKKSSNTEEHHGEDEVVNKPEKTFTTYFELREDLIED